MRSGRAEVGRPRSSCRSIDPRTVQSRRTNSVCTVSSSIIVVRSRVALDCSSRGHTDRPRCDDDRSNADRTPAAWTPTSEWRRRTASSEGASGRLPIRRVHSGAQPHSATHKRAASPTARLTSRVHTSVARSITPLLLARFALLPVTLMHVRRRGCDTACTIASSTRRRFDVRVEQTSPAHASRRHHLVCLFLCVCLRYCVSRTASCESTPRPPSNFHGVDQLCDGPCQVRLQSTGSLGTSSARATSSHEPSLPSYDR
jgi:hypothetical protein